MYQYLDAEKAVLITSINHWSIRSSNQYRQIYWVPFLLGAIQGDLLQLQVQCMLISGWPRYSAISWSTPSQAFPFASPRPPFDVLFLLPPQFSLRFPREPIRVFVFDIHPLWPSRSFLIAFESDSSSSSPIPIDDSVFYIDFCAALKWIFPVLLPPSYAAWWHLLSFWPLNPARSSSFGPTAYANASFLILASPCTFSFAHVLRFLL